jgi:undecaprenyl diphosphate synthase
MCLKQENRRESPYVQEMTRSIVQNPKMNLLDRSRIPHHIAIIPDGNRRWAQLRNLFHEVGHKTGINLLIDIVNAAKESGVKVLTFFLFSTENWNRSKKEITALKWIFQKFLRDNTPLMKMNGIKLKTIGNIHVFSKGLQKTLAETKQATEQCDQIEMVLALNYGSRDEMRRAFHNIIDDYNCKKIAKEEITEALISSYLDSSAWKEPDLLIRTSGEKRLSNFLLWQMAYTEIYFTDRLWPDFTPEDLLDAITDFQTRKRRWGGA